jgi:hypothetical protein
LLVIFSPLTSLEFEIKQEKGELLYMRKKKLTH